MEKLTAIELLTFFIIISIFPVVIVYCRASRCGAHPLFSAAIKTVALQIVQFEIFIAFVECDKKQFFALSSPNGCGPMIKKI